MAGLVEELDNVSAIWITTDENLLEARVRAAERFYSGASAGAALIGKFLPRNVEYNRLMMESVGRLGLESVRVTGDSSTRQSPDRCVALPGT